MPFATWWRGDPLPELPPLPSFAARRVSDRAATVRLTGLPEPIAEARLGAEHDLFVASLADEQVGYGWLARRAGGIEELDFSFEVPPGNAYLWDFVTLPAWRGRGVYPHLLQAILTHEAAVGRFWIGYEADNLASARGIARAGFKLVGDLAVTDGRVSGFNATEPGARARAARALFGPNGPP